MHPFGLKPIRALLSRTNLLTRLLVLVIGVTIPAVLVLLSFQDDLRGQRENLARTGALHQAELINQAVGNIVDGASQVLTAAGDIGAVRTQSPGCGGRLRALRGHLQPYVFLTVLDPQGSAVCSDSGVPPQAEFAGLASRAMAQRGVVLGRYSPAIPGVAGPFIALAQAAPAIPGQPRQVLVAGLSLEWLGTHLAELRHTVGASVTVADLDGTVLAMVSAAPVRLGAKLQPDLLTLVSMEKSGSIIQPAPGGQSRVIGYVPATLPPNGLFVAASFEEADLVVSNDRAATRGYLLIALGGALSMLLALLAGNRLVRAPTLALLDAARRWGEGDLTSRAKIPVTAAGEFQRLGSAFNGMAEMQGQQRAELHALNEALELRVAERTRALLESNNRLQVEIAERELTDADLRQAQKLQAIGQLAGGIAHDFNNLLTAMLGSLDLLRKRLPADDPRQTRLLDTATDAVTRGSRLTSQLLAFSRKQPLLAIPTDVGRTIEDMGGLLSSTLGAGVRVELRLASGLWPAMLDPNQFEAAILNLALNARDAMTDRGRLTIAAGNVTISPSEATRELAAGDYLRVVVADSGRGMDAAVLAQAFDPFFTTKGPGGGSGLGLSQVHGLARQSGGDVQIESRLEEGTRVIMHLPRSPEAPAVTAPSDTFRSMPALTRHEAILLVDDDDAVRDVTAAMLMENGYQVVTAADGGSGLDALRREGDRIQLVIADYAMPGLNGRELLGVIRQERPDMPMLLATGYADYEALTADGLPVDQIVRKPFRSTELLARIHMVRSRTSRPSAS